MPVVDREKERAIVERAQQRGMQPDQIKAAVQAFRAQAAPPAAPVVEQPKGVQGLAGVATGAAKGLASTLTGTATLGEKLIKGLGRIVTPKSLESTFGFQQTPKSSAETLVPEKYRTPEGGAENLGFGVEQVGEFFVPGFGVEKAALKAGELASTASKLAKPAGLLSRLGKRAATEAIQSGGVTALQTGGDVGKVTEATALGALGVPVMKGAGFLGKKAGILAKKAAGPISEAATKYAAEGAGKLTGTGEAAIREAFENPNVVNYIKQAGGDVNKLQNDALDIARTGLSNLRESRGADYVRRLQGIKADTRSLDDAFNSFRSGATSKLTDKADGFGVKLLQKDTLNGPVNVLDFSDSTIVTKAHQDVLQRAFNDVQRWTDNSPAGLDTLKKRLYQIRDNIPVTEGGGARRYVTDLAQGVDDILKKNVPKYQEMTSAYREASDLIEEIEKALSLKDSSATDTAIRKLSSVLRQNNELRLNLIKQLEGATNQDITGRLAAAQFAPSAPRGLAGVLGPLGGAGAFSVGNIPGLLLYLAASSPRLMAKFLNILGKMSKSKPGEVPAVLRMQLNSVIQEAKKEKTGLSVNKKIR